jgi:dihydroorotase
LSIDLVIQNGTIVTSSLSFIGDIGIDAGRIVAIGSPGSVPQGRQSIDAKGKFVLPGLIDGHVHFRDPGLEYKEDFSTGSLAAAFGGITSVVEMPNSKPMTGNADVVQMREELIAARSYVDVGLLGVLVPENGDQIERMVSAGVVGLKIYMGESVGSITTPDNGSMMELMARAAKAGMRTAFHAEDNGILQYMAQKLKATGRKDLTAFVESRPVISEVEAIHRAALFAQYTQAKIHIFHVSSKDGAQTIQLWKQRGVDITGETCPHYLFLRAEEISAKLGPIARVNPPIRESGHGEFLYQSILDGALDSVTTDHAPHTREEKLEPDIWRGASGFIGVETSIPLMLSEAVHKRGMSLNQLVKLCSENPARIWGLWPQKGSLAVGSDADITIVDLEQEWVIDEQKLHSKHRISPWHGWHGKGKPVATVVRGQVVVLEGQLVAEQPVGRMIRPVKN